MRPRRSTSKADASNDSLMPCPVTPHARWPRIGSNDSQAAYDAKVESWPSMPGRTIEFAMRWLPTAD